MEHLCKCQRIPQITRQAGTATVRPSVRFQGLGTSTGGFDGLSPTRGTICRLPKTLKGTILVCVH
jgi:hypothetical protein